MKTDTEEKKIIRCAIYTRKSTSEGLDQDFTSLDNQRESAESYIQSQKSQGWIALPDQYNDGGFTGANIDRPALQKLTDDIKAGKVDCVIVYKVDRLSRSLIDFVKLLQFFEESKVTFVSVTQHFNTQTSMGRLTLNILLSFAQFEREIISERTKDKLGAARKKGRWAGGLPSLGYDIDRANKKLVINPEEAKIIRLMFDLYIQEKSLRTVARLLNEQGLNTKARIYKGKPSGAVKFKNTNIQWMVRNWIYAGKVFHQGQAYQGLHEAIVSEEIFLQANEILTGNRLERGSSTNTKSIGILSGLFRCKECGVAMCHTYSQKGKFRYLYYVCLNAIKRGHSNCPTRSVSADKIENVVLGILRKLSQEPKLKEKAWKELALEEKVEAVKALLKGIDYSAKDAILGLVLHKDSERREYTVELKDLKHIKATKKEAIKEEPKLRQNLALAHQIQDLLDTGKINDVKQLTGHLNMIHVRINQIMGMALLAPKIQEDILLSSDKAIFQVPEYKMNELVREADWDKQTKSWQALLAEYADPSPKTETPSPLLA